MTCKAKPDSVCFDSESDGTIADTSSIIDASFNLAGDIYNICIVDTSSSMTGKKILLTHGK